MSISKKVLLASLLPAVAVTTMAQVTTSSVSGRVVDVNNQVLQGAGVVAIHQPSGTRYAAVTNKDGRFTIQGMRPGGPYRIMVSLLGYEKKVFPGLFLELGSQLPLNVELSEADTELGEAVVQTTKKKRTGTIENFSLESITQTPTVSRHLYDVVKNAPMVQTNKAGGITIAGQNNRYNSFMIDGSVSNDVFGLAASGTNGGQSGANPISIDAIQEIQVSVAPFDVRQSGFTGGAINAVTKQGTNSFKGSAYWLFNNEDMYGRYSMLEEKSIPLTEQSTNTLGFTFGGPIIKDKLFFFTSLENKKKIYPSTYYPGYSDRIISSSVADQIIDIYKQRTGITETYGQRDVVQQSLGFLTRIDWNINEKNKLAFRWQHNHSYDDAFSPSIRNFVFNNSAYRFTNNSHSLVLELNSELAENLHNEFRASATYVRDHRAVPYQGPNVTIQNVVADNSKYSQSNVYIGTDYNSGVNYLKQNIFTIEDNLSIYSGDHTFTVGTHNEFYRMQNGFLQASNGSWSYSSLQDFINDTPYQFSYFYSDPTRTGGDLRYAPKMYFGQFGIYGQDKWNITPQLELTAGLRFDVPLSFNSPVENAEYNVFARQHGFALIGKMPSAKLMASPRVGFRWWTDTERRSLVRGGVGLFTGRVPFVWLSNAYGNTGVELKKVTISDNPAPNMTDYANNPLAGVANGKSAASDLVVIDKKFRYPQALRFNVAWEYRLPADIKMTIEGLYTRNLNAVFFDNLALQANGKNTYAVEGVEASATKNYAFLTRQYRSIINLRSVNKGYSYSLSTLLEKDFDFGLGVKASYTFGRSKSLNDGTSSVAYSNWQYYYAKDAQNTNELSYSRFDIPHRVMVQLNYTSPKYAFGRMSTEVGLVYNGSNGGRYSLLMNEGRLDYNGDGSRGNSLMYIPTTAEVAGLTFVDAKGKALTPEKLAQARENVENWILSDSYASKHRGQYAERNSNLTKWEHEVNLHFAQNFFLPKDWGKLQVSLDIMNFANMLNKKWGATYGNTYSVAPLGLAKLTKDPVTGNNVATFYDNTVNASVNPNNIFSRWHMQLGVRYTF